MLKDKLFVIGGRIDDKPISSMEIFDFKTSRWSKGPDLLGPRDSCSVSFLNGFIYVCGGWNEMTLNSVQCFSIESNTWRNVSNL